MNVKRLFVFLVVFLITLQFACVGVLAEGVGDEIGLTAKEKEYVKNHPIIRSSSGDEAAPIQYVDDEGNVKGIAVELLNEISKKTGFTFEYVYVNAQDSFDINALVGKIDILSRAFYSDNPDEPTFFLQSEPYLTCKAVAYVNDSIVASNFDDKIYATTKRGEMPEGINPDNVKIYQTREQTLEAVNSGEADYGYGNEFSVAFYTVRGGYRNLSIIPTKSGIRQYCFGYINKDEEFVSIINKALNSITDEDLQSMILRGTTQMPNKVSVGQIIYSYGVEILCIASVIMLSMAIFIIELVKANNKTKLHNSRILKLAEISDEYIYQYDIINQRMLLTPKCVELFKNLYGMQPYIDIIEKGTFDIKKENRSLARILNSLTEVVNPNTEVDLMLIDNSIATFRIVSTRTSEDGQRGGFILGKIINISKEKREKEELLIKATHDAMTGILNADSCRRQIIQQFDQKLSNQAGALILIDIDEFKEINDTYGHSIGDEVIICIAQQLRECFRSTDIIGRVGGDEFCVYLQGVEGKKAAEHSINKLRSKISSNTLPLAKYDITISIGACMISGNQDFTKSYKNADKALYQAKKLGKNCYCFYEDN